MTNVHFPGGKGVRIDSALFAGYKIPPYYDSMIAKLIVYDKSRELALRKLRNALGELVLEGVRQISIISMRSSMMKISSKEMLIQDLLTF